MNLSISELISMQQALQEKYFDQWGGLNPEKGRDCILWALIEAGEAADVIKKWGDDAIMREEAQRRHFVEEIGDAVMHLTDALICYGFTGADFTEVYRRKWRYNMVRWEDDAEGARAALPVWEDEAISVCEMVAMQEAFQKKYFYKWGGLQPEKGRNCLLWAIIEAGEAADVIKKWGDEAILENPEQRAHFIEEIGDVIMFFMDTMLCYGLTAEDFAAEYHKKWTRNMTRWD